MLINYYEDSDEEDLAEMFSDYEPEPSIDYIEEEIVAQLELKMLRQLPRFRGAKWTNWNSREEE